MPHFLDGYSERMREILHGYLGGAYFFKFELTEVQGLLTGVLVTYDKIRDDTVEVHPELSWEDFLMRMSAVKPDWRGFDRTLLEQFIANPEKVVGGWEGRTIYLFRGGCHPEHWAPSRATEDMRILLSSCSMALGPIISEQVNGLRENIPVGPTHFTAYERTVRTTLNYIFGAELGEGRAQSRTQPENEGVEIRDILFQNRAESGFWKDLKDKYSASEIVVDAKNTDIVSRDDLRQLYCYLKPALGFWGFIVCRSPPPERIHEYNRTLHKNFCQSRGVLIVADEDLRRMVEMSNRGQRASAYLRDRFSEFVRSI